MTSIPHKMQMNHHSFRIRLLLAAAMLLGTTFSSTALDLPVRNVNGTECYYYEVQPKETIYALGRRFGLTKAQIIQYNPTVADGLRAGQTLYFPKQEIDNLPDARITAAAAAPTAERPEAQTATATSHLVKKGETIYGISRQYGITVDQLIAANPQLGTSGLKSGTVIAIPDKDAPAPEPTPEPAPEPAPAPMPTLPPTVADTAAVDTPAAPTLPEAVVADTDTLRLTIMLPFMLSAQNPDKQTLLYTEFYRGLLLAADSLRHYSKPLVIAAYDTADDMATVDSLLALPEVGRSSVIVAPDDDRQLARIASFASVNGIRVFNLFAVKSTLYRNHAAMMQANIPHYAMYDTAVEGLLREYPDYTPVLLIPQEGGKTDKAEFQSRLRARAEAQSRSIVEVVYQGALPKASLDSLARGGKYMFVPPSGTQTEFARIIDAVKEYKAGLDDYNGARLFGYPEWITFRGEALDNMRFMNTTIYSRFYNDEDSPRSKALADAYSRWYGVAMLNALPVQGILGFDTGMYLIGALNADGDDFPTDHVYRGIQSDYRFAPDDDSAGLANHALYLVNFRPSGITEKISL